MAHSLSDTDPLKPYLLQVINSLKFTLGEPLEINKGVGDLSCNNILIKDFNNIPNELINVSGVYVLYHKENNYFYIGSASSLSTRFKQHILNSSRPYSPKGQEVIINYILLLKKMGVGILWQGKLF